MTMLSDFEMFRLGKCGRLFCLLLYGVVVQVWVNHKKVSLFHFNIMRNFGP